MTNDPADIPFQIGKLSTGFYVRGEYREQVFLPKAAKPVLFFSSVETSSLVLVVCLCSAPFRSSVYRNGIGNNWYQYLPIHVSLEQKGCLDCSLSILGPLD
jgi:hypothetical protein